MRQNFMFALGAALVVALVAGAAFLIWPSLRQNNPLVATSTSTLQNPTGDAPNRKEPGGQHYAQGRYPEAIAHWTQAAAAGDAGAAHRLGVEYMDGKPGVVQRDAAKAMRYHRQAAEAGNALSMFDVGTMHEYALGVPKNLAEAAKWYGHSARYGLAQGQYNFATMLEAGEGAPKDEIEAYKFFILAARGGFTGVPYDNRNLRIDREAPLPTQLLEKKLTRQQQEDGRARAAAFKPATGPLKPE